MLLLKANPELKKVFEKLIKAMKLPVTWTDTFIITNSNLILAGEVRSLIFNFDHKKAYTTIMEIPAESGSLESMPGDSLLNNVMNMTLYAFGKWGIISSLKVDKNYDALNALFKNILRPVNIEPDFNAQNFRFFKNDIQITYEDTMLSILRLLKEEGKLKEGQSLVTSEIHKKKSDDSREGGGPNASESGNGADAGDAEEDGYRIGLWHNLCWKKDFCTFEKAAISDEDTARSRIGRNFYITNYQCPKCKEKLYMAVYPVDKELLIDTKEGRVFMARTYACNECNAFFTPYPKKLLQEGDIFGLKFDEDRTAFEDYLDLLGQKADKTTNYKFNEFEADREAANQTGETASKTDKTAPEAAAGSAGHRLTEPAHATGLKGLTAQLAESGSRLFSKNKKASGMQADNIGHRHPDNTKPVAEPAGTRSGHAAETDSSNAASKVSKVRTAADASQMGAARDVSLLPGKTTEELKTILTALERQKIIINTSSGEDFSDTRYIDAVRETLRGKLTAEYDAQMESVDTLPLDRLSELRKQIDKESALPAGKKQEYRRRIDSRLYEAETKALAQQTENCKNKPYKEIEQVIIHVKNRDIPDELKQDALQKLTQIKADRAKREVEHLLTHMPLHLDRKQLSAYLDKLDEYKEVDLTPYRKQLEQRKDMAEKEEISAMVNRSNKKDRNALWNLYEKLQEQDYQEENKAPFLEKIYEKVRMLDEARIEHICPSMSSLSFSEAQKAYDEISEGMFLPELKTNALEMIKRRLTKLKTDESVQLMRKLKHDMEEKFINCEPFYFYNAREELKSAHRTDSRNEAEQTPEKHGSESSNRTAMLNAVNGYASAREPYEYPLMVCDISRTGSGKEGFVLTPDHIFYHTFLNSGKISIHDIDKVLASKKLFRKGIFIQRANLEKEKLPGNMKAKELNAFAKVLDDFVHYLQEKPESRSVEYMAKENHIVKCCYRCGFIYKNGTVCPKCGSKMNL